MMPVILLSVLFLPFVLWPVEKLLPFPFLVEELVKVIYILLIIKEEEATKERLISATVVGVLFALSESFFFLLNIQAVGTPSTLVTRLVLTLPLHVVTTVLIMLPTLLNKKLIILGFILAATLHFLFNMGVTKLANGPF
ncbi:hypothetical protein A3A76_00205 [Candidatus Woesebacteria bacterium RIFCSPLOWO2_01_FULL_39_23]|uniref:PrsW family intramembrane metalloprotease n=1 Tax=Candidatus Woesebacteria bacterium RIFCSPHIGHO2_01_FULL_40_22 TaxID=1802499 RepID=A0A1F7YG40_9BACT|nr:MAG: hypothetical protein A2141_02935 [Candidatus Woesebacteria bacterium RBG_16_40_11]OGM26304.1 MAG: hypothetical protein A2628_03825 [Candidatus Woesebacteria bacterium RIFCSPHIGHO2_01_FULL_40_22]OGM35989.1 MAG: hypothetical protein A3E41_00990 [Candidatus Woesebacteria bacterium RIFCSPHIGHO2_12_FULL_38_9]OGM62859.1 MAG: hypothetical protein A3A76_00205 [Candidatus Woesebacteria bacterium RIFCSPLOWO2_01_FULL_39_23]